MYKLQFGFESGKSTVHPLINYIAEAFNKNEYAVMLLQYFLTWLKRLI